MFATATSPSPVSSLVLVCQTDHPTRRPSHRSGGTIRAQPAGLAATARGFGRRRQPGRSLGRTARRRAATKGSMSLADRGMGARATKSICTTQSALLSTANPTGPTPPPAFGVTPAGPIPRHRVRFVHCIGPRTPSITPQGPPLSRVRFHEATADFQAVEAIRWPPDPNDHPATGIDGTPLSPAVLTTFPIPARPPVGWSATTGRECTIASSVCESILTAVLRMPDPSPPHAPPESVPIPMPRGAAWRAAPKPGGQGATPSTRPVVGSRSSPSGPTPAREPEYGLVPKANRRPSTIVWTGSIRVRRERPVVGWRGSRCQYCCRGQRPGNGSGGAGKRATVPIPRR